MREDGSVDHFWAVVPAGGAGTRLWPLSRQGAPKFLHDLAGDGRTLLQGTLDRLAPLVADRVLVVTGRPHRDAVRQQLPELPDERVVAEPSPRDSMAAIGLAAAMLERLDPDAVMGSFAADHVVTDRDRFARAATSAVAAARAGWLATIGIEPTHPATGFGYIEVGEPLAEVPGAFRARQFVEKPPADVAREYVAAGHRWNAGMFVVRPTVLLDLLARTDPDFAAALRRVAAQPESLEETWADLPRIAIDHAVAEPAAAAGRVAVVAGDFGWDDVGDFASLAALRRAGRTPEEDRAGEGDRRPPDVLGDPGLVRAVDAGGLVVPAGGRVVAVVGIDDVVVVDTPDAVLVTRLGRAQDVKTIVAALEEGGHGGLR